MNVEKLVNQGLDLRAALGIPVRQVIPWVVAVMFITYMGYSGVICITPMAWLMALRVGIQVSVTSKSAERSNRLREAGVAGGTLGLLQGILFAVFIPLMGPIRNDEMVNSFILVILLLLVGTLAGAGLSLFTAFLNENRTENKINKRI